VPPKRNWIQEERRKVLGDWVALCLGCGHAHRWFDEFESEVPTECPQCGGPIRRRCVECNAPFASVFAVDCEECGAALRDPTLLGLKIRKS
jgi:predicted nucleic acid-binding Zn ribbon protein